MTSAALTLLPATAGAERSAPSPRRAVRALRLLEAIGYTLLALSIFFICFTFLRPSPYDFIAIPAMALWLALGIRLHRGRAFPRVAPDLSPRPADRARALFGRAEPDRVELPIG